MTHRSSARSAPRFASDGATPGPVRTPLDCQIGRWLGLAGCSPVSHLGVTLRCLDGGQSG